MFYLSYFETQNHPSTQFPIWLDRADPKVKPQIHVVLDKIKKWPERMNIY